MERLLTASVCGLLAALLFGLLGALFGGTVRALAKLRDRVPDATVGEAFRKGAKGGAGFLAVVGGLFGVLVGVLEPSAEASMQALLEGAGTIGMLMLVIGLGIALPTTVVVWTALRYRQGKTLPAAATETDDTEGDQKTG